MQALLGQHVKSGLAEPVAAFRVGFLVHSGIEKTLHISSGFRRMKVLHVIPAYYPSTYWGGPIFTTYHLNNALAHLPDVELKVVTTDSAGPHISDRLDVTAVDRGHFPNQEVIFTRRIFGSSISLGLLRRLPALVRWADVVHLTATYSFPTIPTILVCRYLRTPLVWSLRGAILDDESWRTLRKKRLKWLFLKLCNSLIRRSQVCLHTTTEGEKAASLPKLPHAGAVVVKNGVEVPSSLPERQWRPDGRLRLLYLGRLAPKKGIENLLEAMALFAEDPGIDLTLYGAGDEEYTASLKAHARKLGLPESRVHFSGHVDGSAKSQAFLQADVFVLPSFSENFGVVVAEALASELPVIVSSRLPQWRDIETYDCGLWVGNDPESLARSIRKIQTMDLPAMGRRGWQWMKGEFEWDPIGRDMYGVYERIVKRE